MRIDLRAAKKNYYESSSRSAFLIRCRISRWMPPEIISRLPRRLYRIRAPDSLQAIFSRLPDLIRTLSSECKTCLVFSIDRWLVPPKPKQPPASVYGKFAAFRPYQLTLPYMRNNYVYLIFLAVYVLVNAMLFGTRVYQYRNANVYTILARACGESHRWVVPVRNAVPEAGEPYRGRNRC